VAILRDPHPAGPLSPRRLPFLGAAYTIVYGLAPPPEICLKSGAGCIKRFIVAKSTGPAITPSAEDNGRETPVQQQSAATIGADEFRRVLGHFATGVTTVTALDPATGRPLGLTVNSFVSVSLRPPLVSFCVRDASSTWPALRRAGSLCINILGADQSDICARMAAKGPERFEGLDWSPSPSGAPVLAGVVAWIEGTVEAEHPAGDHAIVVVRVRHMRENEHPRPLVFLRGEYGRFTR